MQTATLLHWRERERFTSLVTSVGFTVHPSSTNCVLRHVGSQARELAQGLMTEGLIVRSYPADHLLGDHIRFTVRSQTEVDRLIDVISTIYPQLVGVPRS